MKHIQSTFVLGILFVLSTNLVHAQKCRYVKNEIDPITNEITRSIKLLFYLESYGCAEARIIYNRMGDNYNILIDVKSAGELNHIVKPGAEMILKLSSGEIIKLKSTEPASPISTVEGNSICTTFKVKFDISKDIMVGISKDPIVFIRTDFNNGLNDLKLKKKNSERTRSFALCMLKD